MKKVDLICTYCNKGFEKALKEFNRQKRNGRDVFFCGLSCSAKYLNAPRKKPEIKVICEHCDNEFSTIDARFCSRSCASAGSVTDYRRAKARETVNISGAFSQNHSIDQKADTLKKREAWKYEKIKKILLLRGIKHEFELVIEDRIFDLSLPKLGVLVEFDGSYHRNPYQVKIDDLKDKLAKKHGWRMKRIITENNCVIPARVLSEILK